MHKVSKARSKKQCLQLFADGHSRRNESLSQAMTSLTATTMMIQVSFGAVTISLSHTLPVLRAVEVMSEIIFI